MKSTRCVAVMAMVLVPAVAHGDPAKAKKLNVQGMAKYKAKEYEDAEALFQKAIDQDDKLAIAHYNLASMAALVFDVEVLTRELAWLKASADPKAASYLAKGKSDKDFLGVTTLPKVRELLGMPAWDALTTEQKLLEAGGGWRGIDIGCARAWDEYHLAKGGKLTWRSYCYDDGVVHHGKGTWTADDKGVHLTTGDTADFQFGPCGKITAPDMDPDGTTCLLGESVELSRIGK